MRAVDQIGRINLRERRAMSVASAILNIVGPYICEHGEDARHNMRDVYRKIVDLFHQDGIEILSDYDRQQYGLPPRGPDGWTAEEIIAMERRKLEILSAPITVTMPVSSEAT